uniref:Uncharacterized protein n=1 Tax=Glossina pallidipes TaxID=7398 RepID=A0A1A9ZTD5_GLOPL
MAAKFSIYCSKERLHLNEESNLDSFRETHTWLNLTLRTTFTLGPLRRVRTCQKTLNNAGSEGTSIEYCNGNTIPRIYLCSLLDRECLLDIIFHAEKSPIYY